MPKVSFGLHVYKITISRETRETYDKSHDHWIIMIIDWKGPGLNQLLESENK